MHEYVFILSLYRDIMSILGTMAKPKHSRKYDSEIESIAK